jgi:hypothetical protein
VTFFRDREQHPFEWTGRESIPRCDRTISPRSVSSNASPRSSRVDCRLRRHEPKRYCRLMDDSASGNISCQLRAGWVGGSSEPELLLSLWMTGLTGQSLQLAVPGTQSFLDRHSRSLAFAISFFHARFRRHPTRVSFEVGQSSVWAVLALFLGSAGGFLLSQPGVEAGLA